MHIMSYQMHPFLSTFTTFAILSLICTLCVIGIYSYDRGLLRFLPGIRPLYVWFVEPFFVVWFLINFICFLYWIFAYIEANKKIKSANSLKSLEVIPENQRIMIERWLKQHQTIMTLKHDVEKFLLLINILFFAFFTLSGDLRELYDLMKLIHEYGAMRMFRDIVKIFRDDGPIDQGPIDQENFFDAVEANPGMDPEEIERLFPVQPMDPRIRSRYGRPTRGVMARRRF